jgi:hypothetical protein
MNFDEYKAFYEKTGHCVNTAKTKNKLNDIQLLSKYNKYLKTLQKQADAKKRHSDKAKEKIIEIDEKWIEIREAVFKRDSYTCQFMKILNSEELKLYKQIAGSFIKVLDPAHIITRSEAPSLVYDIDNIITISRIAHSYIDHFQDPITGKSMTKEEQLKWWYRIVGESRYKLLKENVRG